MKSPFDSSPDAWFKRWFSLPRKLSPVADPQWPNPTNIAEFSYSRLRDFRLFANQPFRPFNVKVADPNTSNLKVYQDYLTYCFIRRNIPAGSRILDIGGGDSRILRFFSRAYECWNVDKCEGLGNGPLRISSRHFRTVYQYIGEFSPELPDNYFDLAFSISSLEHTAEDPQTRASILKDINRVLKPGAASFHLLDIVARPHGQTWINGLIPYLYQNAPLLTVPPDPTRILADPDTYYMSESAFDAYWLPAVRIPYRDYGRPLSITLFWNRET